MVFASFVGIDAKSCEQVAGFGQWQPDPESFVPNCAFSDMHTPVGASATIDFVQLDAHHPLPGKGLVSVVR